MKECLYCMQTKNNGIHGMPIRTDELKETAGYYEPIEYKDHLELFILKGKDDTKAGLMLENLNGTRYIDINYCPICGRKLNEED